MQSIAAMIQKANGALNQAAVTVPSAPAVAPAVGTPSPVDSPLAPNEQLNDGNKCPDDEEEFPKLGGTCFKKCSDLTGSQFPIRTSPFSCCASKPCSFSNSQVHLNFCGGFDVAGDAEHGGCPASEGACLDDEELFDGICYKKCSSFDPVHWHRVAPNMCCKTKGFQCLMPSNFKFSAQYATGGGCDDSNAGTPCAVHPPMQALTEQTQ
eukprot:gb/GFBE01031108.1/.p1 GENE.gb/GFBE01031108.1/~~gb/GFBE01031108.1/.p1  ORF type:complete len:209 (+),score=32.08 gb/GFBE01031108.1/:1-627(+)